MKYIKSIHLRNFQCHKKLDIVLDRNITTFVGASDKGKSSILRALRCLALNKPLGDGYITHGQKSCTVAVTTSEGKKIKRTRSRKKPTVYTMDGVSYKAIGSHPPPLFITQSLGLFDINFQRQTDMPFWFYESPVEVSRQLNSYVSLELMDKAVDVANRKVKECTTFSIQAKGVVDHTTAIVEELREAPQVKEEFQGVEQLYERYALCSQRASSLKALVTTITALRPVINAGAKALKQGLVVKVRARKHIAAKKTHKALKTLVELINKCGSYQNIIDAPIRLFVNVQRVRKAADEAAEKRRSLDLLLTRVAELKLGIEAGEWKIQTLIEKSKSTKKTLCPTCGQVLNTPLVKLKKEELGHSPSSHPTSTSQKSNPSGLNCKRGRRG